MMKYDMQLRLATEEVNGKKVCSRLCNLCFIGGTGETATTFCNACLEEHNYLKKQFNESDKHFFNFWRTDLSKYKKIEHCSPGENCPCFDKQPGYYIFDIKELDNDPENSKMQSV